MSQWQPGAEIRYGDKRRTARLGQALGSGGEADVFGCLDSGHENGLAIKIFRTDATRPLKTIVDVGNIRLRQDLRKADPAVPGDFFPIVCAPRAVIYAPDDQIIGIGILKAPPHFNQSLYNFLRLKDSKDLSRSLTVAAGVAECVEYLHERHYVIGDLSPHNFLVSKYGSVTCLDIDSAGIRGQNGKRKLLVPPSAATDGFKAPEMITEHASIDTDLFALGILVGHLTLGLHPFHGTRIDKSSSTAQANIFARTSWLEHRNDFILPKPQAAHPGLDQYGSSRLASHIRKALLSRADGSRPSAASWKAALVEAQGRLERCSCSGWRFSSGVCAACATPSAPGESSKISGGRIPMDGMSTRSRTSGKQASAASGSEPLQTQYVPPASSVPSAPKPKQRTRTARPTPPPEPPAAATPTWAPPSPPVVPVAKSGVETFSGRASIMFAVGALVLRLFGGAAWFVGALVVALIVSLLTWITTRYARLSG